MVKETQANGSLAMAKSLIYACSPPVAAMLNDNRDDEGERLSRVSRAGARFSGRGTA
jgi:hypothetical protein